MSQKGQSEHEVDAVDAVEPATEAQAALSDLMQAPAAAATRARLDATAAAAAEAAVSAAERALAAVEVGLPPRPAAPASWRLWALRVVILLNFALMGIMVALPSPAPVNEPTPAEPTAEPAPPSPFVQPLRDPRLTVPVDAKYDEALLAGRDGDYAKAAELMQEYVRAHPTLHPSLLHGAYVLLGRYLRLSGRVDEAVAYETLSQRLVGIAHLPEDLWRTARAAEARGDAGEMRRAYARLLLQRSMLTPTQRAIVTEAYLALGDSYRLEAQQGEQRSQEAGHDDDPRDEPLERPDDEPQDPPHAPPHDAPSDPPRHGHEEPR